MITADDLKSARVDVAAAPVGSQERVAALDVLRGVALFGVFLINMVGFAGENVMATQQQLLALPTHSLDLTLHQFIVWLGVDKANTLFAFLFGLGFYLQMQRLSERGADFERIYLRRLTALLLIGVAHTFLLWTWDILHVYAIAGFMLFALRKVSNRTLLVGGLLLAVLARIAQASLIEFGGLDSWHGHPSPYSQEAVLMRQQLSQAGDYWGLVHSMSWYYFLDFIANGLLAAWLLYVLGRFMLGAWVGRHGWLQHARDYLPGFRRVLRLALPAGLVIAAISQLINIGIEDGRLSQGAHWAFTAEVLHLVSVPALAAGYICAVVVGLHTKTGAKLLAPFAYAGRMALTNYITQSFVYGFVLFGVGPGLALAGKIGTAAVTLIVIGAYALQIAFSRWWLARFRYGPLEWVWRALTYGYWPKLAVA